ncbi:MAG TPA: methyltransferase [Clostridiales bacterium]|nr:methyltransferase [Clostridiales bacterium]
MEIYIKELRLDDLQVNGLKIYQHKDKYCFTSDAVILANFARVKKNEVFVDLGSGSGIISILLAGKYNASMVHAVEIQEYLAKMSKLSVDYNNLAHKIKVHNTPMQTAHKILGKHTMDAVICNPPYTRQGDGEKNQDLEIAICRHEIKVNLEEVIKSAADLVKYGGRFYLIHQVERLSQIFFYFHKYKFQPKRLRFIQGKIGLRPNLVMIEAYSYGNEGLIVEQNLILYDENGQETPELNQIYGRIKK